jgi:hypothetical protein
MREAVIPFPAMPAWMPMGTVVAALLVEAAWTLIQTRGVSARKAIPAFAAAAAAVLTVLIPLQSAVLFQAPVPGFLETVTFLAPTALVALVVGALAGIAARQIGLMLRLLDTPARMAVTA